MHDRSALVNRLEVTLFPRDGLVLVGKGEGTGG